jgi:hypothetical protein
LVTLGAGTPLQIARRRRSAVMLLTFCSSSRRRRRRPDRHHYREVAVPLLCLEATFSGAEGSSAMPAKFREQLDGAMLPGLWDLRPRAALCMR